MFYVTFAARDKSSPVREGVTPLVLEKVVWAGANPEIYQQAVAALQVLAEIPLPPSRCSG